MATAPTNTVWGSGLPASSAFPWGTAAKAGSGAAGGFAQGMGNKKQAKAQAKNYNDWLKQRQGMVGTPGDPSSGSLTKALMDAGYNPFGPQETKTNTTGSSTGTSTTSFNNLSMPEWSKADQGVLGMQRKMIEGRQAQASGGYEGQVLNAARQAANAAEIARGKETGALARRGINPAQAGMLPSQRALNQQVLDIQTNLPRQLSNEDLGLAQQFLGMTKGQREKGTSTTNTASQFAQAMSQLSPPDMMKLLAFFGAPSPEMSSAGAGWSAAGAGLSSLGGLL